MILFNSTVDQPEKYTPVGAEHVYSFTSNNLNQPNFKFVLDVYTDPNKPFYKKIARVKVRPNQYGYAHIDVSEIIKSIVKPNIKGRRFNREQLAVDVNFQRSSLMTLPRLVNWASSNAYNEVDSSEDFEYFDFEPEYHAREYRVLIGEEYTIGTIPTTFIATDPTQKHSNFYVTAETNDPEVSWVDAQGDVEVTWSNTLGLPVYESQIFSNPPTFNTWTPSPLISPPPQDNDLLRVKDLGVGYTVSFLFSSELNQWIFSGTQWDDPYNGHRDPYSIITVPGADNRIMNTRTLLNDFTDNPLLQNHLYDSFIYYIPPPSVVGPIDDYKAYPSRIPLVAPYFNGLEPTNTELGTRRFTIYNNQPLTFPVLQGEWGFTNEIRYVNLVAYYPDGTDTTFSKANETNVGGILDDASTDAWPTVLDVSQRLSWIGFNDLWDYWYTVEQQMPIRLELSYSTNKNDRNEVSSEKIIMDVKPTTCYQDEPVYLTYLNSNGYWQSITFGAVDVQTLKFDKSSYKKSKYNGGTNYVRLVDKATEIFNMKGEVEIEAQSDFVSNNDSLQYVDCISSPQVYLVRGFNTTYQGGVNGEVIPVTITSKNVQYKKGYYDKLKRYTIRMTLDNINQYRFGV